MSFDPIVYVVCSSEKKEVTMKYICVDCGEEYDPDEAVDEFNSYFNGRFDYELNSWSGYCGFCAISGQKSVVYDDDDDMPAGCRACGGDYPNCTSSCPMFD